MTGLVVSIVFAFLLATLFGCVFHLLVGGPAGRIILYVALANVGFAVGHFFGQGMDIEAMKLGPLYLLTAAVGAAIFLIGGRWLWPNLEESG